MIPLVGLILNKWNFISLLLLTNLYLNYEVLEIKIIGQSLFRTVFRTFLHTLHCIAPRSTVVDRMDVWSANCLFRHSIPAIHYIQYVDEYIKYYGSRISGTGSGFTVET